MDEDFGESQWTEKAKQAYQQRADELVEALQAHLATNLTRSGRQRELGAYFASAETLMTAARDFNNAEFDWCGSVPFTFDLDEAEDDDMDDVDDVDDVDDESPQGDVLSVLGRWDFRILDEQVVISAGRDAYLRVWPDDTEEDASIRVQDVEAATGELMHADGFAGIETAPGLRIERHTMFVVTHEGDDDETFDTDPFGINRA